MQSFFHKEYNSEPISDDEKELAELYRHTEIRINFFKIKFDKLEINMLKVENDDTFYNINFTDQKHQSNPFLPKCKYTTAGEMWKLAKANGWGLFKRPRAVKGINKWWRGRQSLRKKS